MADNTDNHQTDGKTTETEGEDKTKVETKKLSEEHEQLVEKILAERLSKMKGNVDKAYEKAEELARENARLKSEQKEAARKRLEDEGKHLEAAKMKLVELEENNKILNERLTSATRDRELDQQLTGLEFRNEFARNTVFNAIIGDLVQDSDGIWVHKSGASIKEFVTAFSKDPDKEFLFKPKDNKGAGTSNQKGMANSGGRPDSLKGLSGTELMKLAAEGKFGDFKF